MLTVDNTDPVVTVTAPASAEDGDPVMISAMVTEAGTVSSVTADVSALDSTQTAMLTLAMGLTVPTVPLTLSVLTTQP